MAVFGLPGGDRHRHLRPVYWPNTFFLNAPWRESAWKSECVCVCVNKIVIIQLKFAFQSHSLCISTCCNPQHFPTRAQTFCSDQRWARWFISVYVKLGPFKRKNFKNPIEISVLQGRSMKTPTRERLKVTFLFQFNILYSSAAILIHFFQLKQNKLW